MHTWKYCVYVFIIWQTPFRRTTDLDTICHQTPEKWQQENIQQKQFRERPQGACMTKQDQYSLDYLASLNLRLAVLDKYQIDSDSEATLPEPIKYFIRWNRDTREEICYSMSCVHVIPMSDF